MNHLYKTLITSSLLLIGVSLQAQPQRPQVEEGWQYSLGIGSMIKPKYKGSQDYDFWPIPYFDIKYGDTFYLTPARGAGFKFKTDSGFDYGVGLGFDFGRDEDDGDLLNGMGEVDFGLLAKAEVGYTIEKFRLGLEVAKEFSGAHDGYQLQASIARSFMIREWKSILNIQAFAAYASEEYLNTYFGVDPLQSINTGYDQIVYEAGINEAGLTGTWIRPINKDWSFLGLLRYSRLLGDIGDSPVVESENQFFGGFFFVRKM